ncbi:MAG: peptide ABC transporter substrate-binding protein [Alphaproteobacteria bacterium]
MRRFLRTLLGLAALAAAQAALPSPAAAKDELVIGITQFPSTFHPDIDAMVAKSYILAMSERPFTAYDASWQLICMLCTELPTFENGLARREKTPDGKDGIALTYKIQPAASWGDGTPVTARDVLFAWKVGREPKSGIGNFELYRRILKIDAVDDKTFVLHADRVTFDYNAINDFRALPAHLEEAAFADPAQYRTRTRFDTDTTNPGLYFGPYRITQVSPGAFVVLEPNPTWYGAKPFFKRIVVKVIENTAALEANLLSGGIDYIAGELGLTLDQALAFEAKHGTGYRYIYKPGLTYEHVDFNLDNPSLGDLRVRQALAYGLDRNAVNERLFGGRQPPANSFMSPLDWPYAKDLAGYPYDAKKAAALLDEAGWKPGAGGLRRNAKGGTLALELMSTAGNRIRELVEQVLQSQWKALGIDVRIRNEPARVFFGETVKKRKFPAMAMYAWVSAPENVPRSTLHSSEIPTEANGWGGQNNTGYKSAEMDKLIDEIEVELDRGKRRTLWHRIQELYIADLPVIPLFYRADPFIIPTWLEGIVPTGHEDPSSLWVETWRSTP